MNKTQNTTGQVINKARLTPGRQWVAINNIEWPVEVQPRAGIDMEWVRQLSEFRKEGSEFPPIKVFQTPEGRLIGAEGHHRSLAMFKADEDQILCDVVDGTMEDAIVYAAGSNRSNGVKPMGPKDITKAIEMLLAIDDWWRKSTTIIAKHVGCSSNKVTKIRARISAETGKPLPEIVETCNGGKKPRKRARGNEPRKISRCQDKPGGKTYYRTRYKNQEIRGETPEEVQNKMNLLINKDSFKLAPRSIDAFLEHNGFAKAGFKSKEHPGLSGIYRRNSRLCSSCDFVDVNSLPLCIGRLVGGRRHGNDLAVRMIVLCYPEDGPQKVIDLYRAEGFEFLTPEELAEELKRE